MYVVGWIPGEVTLHQRLVYDFISGALGNQDLLGRDWVEGGVEWQRGYPHGELCSYNSLLELTPFGAWRLDFSRGLHTVYMSWLWSPGRKGTLM